MADATPDSVSRPSMSRARPHRGLYWSAAAVLLVIAGGLLARFALVRGWWQTIRVAGGSMAEAYLGPHWNVTCRECGMTFHCGVEHPPNQNQAVCPNCGCRDNPVHPANTMPGDQVWIDGWARITQGLQPWQAVAFSDAAASDVLTVKRLVARGPGQVAIHDGDVYLNGEIQRKSLEQLREMSVLVHDDAFRAMAGSRWRPSSETSCWSVTPSGYAADWSREHNSGDDFTEEDLLEYVQWTCWPNDDPRRERTKGVPIVDHDPYNQGFVRGTLQAVSDLCLTCELRMGPHSRAAIRLRSRTDNFIWEFDSEVRSSRLTWNNTLLCHVLIPSETGPFQIEMAVCDHQLLAAVAGQPVVAHAYQPGLETAARHGASIAIAAEKGTIEVLRPRVARDVHYTGPRGVSDWESPQSLTADQWFVLGDNVPISIDSRRYGGVESATILGPVRHRSR